MRTTRFRKTCQSGGGTVAVKFIEKFLKNELAIDLGTVNTLIYQPGKGILLNEPSVVALDRYDGEVVCVGHKALKLLGREPRGIEVHRPIHSGTIFNFEVTRKMLLAVAPISSTKGSPPESARASLLTMSARISSSILVVARRTSRSSRPVELFRRRVCRLPETRWTKAFAITCGPTTVYRLVNT